MKVSNKSILVIDTPETCLDCMFCFELDEGVNACCSIMPDKNNKSLCRDIQCDGGHCQDKPGWCPLKELPKEENGDEDLCSFDRGWTAGFNTCLQKINGEK